MRPATTSIIIIIIILCLYSYLHDTTKLNPRPPHSLSRINVPRSKTHNPRISRGVDQVKNGDNSGGSWSLCFPEGIRAVHPSLLNARGEAEERGGVWNNPWRYFIRGCTAVDAESFHKRCSWPLFSPSLPTLSHSTPSLSLCCLSRALYHHLSLSCPHPN